MTDSSNATVYPFQAEVSEVLGLVIHSLYSNREIFLRELVSNASDALDKLRFRAITEPALLPSGQELQIRLLPDKAAQTLSVVDNGVGMSRDDLVTFLGTVAHSGSKRFVEALRAQGQTSGDVSLIGQFGVGFYSAFLVADRVDVISRAAGSDEAHRWSSDAKGTFTIEPATRDEQGTTVVLHLRDDQKDYLDGWRLRSVVRRWSDFVSYPVRVPQSDDESAAALETVNRTGALWRRSASDVTADDYQAFYEHIAHDDATPLAHTHFVIEGAQQFWGLLYIPRTAPFDLFEPEARHGVRLYVRRVLIMEQCDDLLPRWLRFVRGVVDSDDLPLNVSRELLQDSRAVRTIRRQVVKKVLELLEQVAAERPDDWNTLWTAFGRVLKEGVATEPEHRERIAKLLRFGSSAVEGNTSLADYVGRMKEGQAAIYYVVAPSRRLGEGGPHVEALLKRGFEVLYLTDPVDQWVVDSLPEFDGRKLVSATSADLELGDEAREQGDTSGVAAHFRRVLGDRVADVRISSRLSESPVCLVTPRGGMASHIERLLRAHDSDLPVTKRILEVNPDHPVVVNLGRLLEQSPESVEAAGWVEMLYDQALLAEGSPIDDPAMFARRLSELLQRATASANA